MSRPVPPTPHGQPSKVLPFPRRRTSSPFDKLTTALVMEKHRRGVLPAAMLEYLLAGVGLS
jgi:hypothetical protein